VNINQNVYQIPKITHSSLANAQINITVRDVKKRPDAAQIHVAKSIVQDAPITLITYQNSHANANMAMWEINVIPRISVSRRILAVTDPFAAWMKSSNQFANVH